jgi:hypothetical protein
VLKKITHLIAADARRRWESEPTVKQAEHVFLVGLPVGLAAILYAIGSGFGL